MKTIPLTQGKHAIVDDKWFNYLNRWKWRASKEHRNWYAVRTDYPSKVNVAMHRIIMGLCYKDGKQVDHINHNGLDNREENLRICTNQQNCQHQRTQNRSMYRGISWHKGDKRWRARIKINGKSIHLGNFKNPINAAKRYDIEARKLFGEFAYTNFKAVACDGHKTAIDGQ